MIFKHKKIIDKINRRNFMAENQRMEKQESSLTPLFWLVIFLTLLTLMFGPRESHAGIETDKMAGNCAGLLTTLHKPARAADAIGYADNRDRAVKFGVAWLEKIKNYAGNESKINSLIYSASSDCRNLGIRASD